MQIWIRERGHTHVKSEGDRERGWDVDERRMVGTKRNSSTRRQQEVEEEEEEERVWWDDDEERGRERERERERWSRWRKGVWEMREKEEQEERRIALITRSWRKKKKKKKKKGRSIIASPRGRYFSNRTPSVNWRAN